MKSEEYIKQMIGETISITHPPIEKFDGRELKECTGGDAVVEEISEDFLIYAMSRLW